MTVSLSPKREVDWREALAQLYDKIIFYMLIKLFHFLTMNIIISNQVSWGNLMQNQLIYKNNNNEVTIDENLVFRLIDLKVKHFIKYGV